MPGKSNMIVDVNLEALKNTRGKKCPCVYLKEGESRENYICPCMDFINEGKCICGVFKKIEN